MINDFDVAIAGVGPTGLLLAGDLARAGVSCAVFERRPERSGLTRAFAVHARTLEQLDARGVADQARRDGDPRLRSSGSSAVRHSTCPACRPASPCPGHPAVRDRTGA